MSANTNQMLAFFNFRDDILPVMIVMGIVVVLWVLWKEYLARRR